MNTVCRGIIMETLEEQKAQALHAVKSTLRLEKDPLFTQNTHYYQTTREAWLAHFKLVHHHKTSYIIEDLQELSGTNVKLISDLD